MSCAANLVHRFIEMFTDVESIEYNVGSLQQRVDCLREYWPHIHGHGFNFEAAVGHHKHLLDELLASFLGSYWNSKPTNYLTDKNVKTRRPPQMAGISLRG